MDSYKNDIEVVATSLDIIDGQMPNKSEIQIEDAKRKDNSNLGIEINQGVLDIPVGTWNSEQELAQITTYANVQKIKANSENRKTQYADQMRKAYREDIGR